MASVYLGTPRAITLGGPSVNPRQTPGVTTEGTPIRPFCQHPHPETGPSSCITHPSSSPIAVTFNNCCDPVTSLYKTSIPSLSLPFFFFPFPPSYLHTPYIYTMLAIGDAVLRITNFVFLVIALGLTGSLAATTKWQDNPQVNFAVFASAFGILFSSFYGLLAYFVAALAWPVVLFLFDFLNTIFTFAAATAIAAGINVHSCDNQEYLDNNNITQGSTGRCRKAQASTAFLYFSFFIFLASAVFSGISIGRGGIFGGSSRSRGVGVPSVSQV